MDSTSHTDSNIPSTPATEGSQVSSTPPPPPPTTSKNWGVIAIVALAGALMIWVGVHNARKGSSSTADRAAMVGNVKGKVAPDFTLKTVDGKQVKLSDLRGKAVLLNFWATWCEPCKVEIPWFVDLQKQYGGQGLEIVGVAMDDNASPDKIGKFAQQLGVNYTILVEIGRAHV